MTNKKVKLILEDGSSYEGYSFGALANTSGEVVFNTGMVGYPESMTDPSYRGQILVLTYPLIGNYGVPSNKYELCCHPELVSGSQNITKEIPKQVRNDESCKILKYFESDKIQIQGLIVSDYSQNYSHWNAVKSLGEWMEEQGIPGIYGVDTRALAKKLREKGSMLGQIFNFQFSISNKISKSKIQNPNYELKATPVVEQSSLRGKASYPPATPECSDGGRGKLKANFEDPNKRNLVAEGSIKKPIVYYPSSVIPDRKSQSDASGRESSKILDSVSELHSVRNDKYQGKKIVLVDTGGKYNIIRSLLNRGVTVIRVPWDYDFFNNLRITNRYEYTNNNCHSEFISESHQKEMLKQVQHDKKNRAWNDKQGLDFDGIILTNGPGDPKMCKQTIVNVKKAMAKNIPIFGICLGNQILALAAGANTYKLKYGHRSQNQPCIEVGTKRCYITSQNHGYAVNTKTLPRGWREWFVNANDGTNEGIRHQSKPFMSVQFHPEATPGPVDTGFLFDRFLNMI